MNKENKVTSFAREHGRILLVAGLLSTIPALEARAQDPYWDVTWGNPGSAPAMQLEGKCPTDLGYCEDMNLCIDWGSHGAVETATPFPQEGWQAGW